MASTTRYLPILEFVECVAVIKSAYLSNSGAPQPMVIDFPAVPPLVIAPAAPIQNANVNATMTLNRSIEYVSGRVQETIDASYRLNRTYPQ